MTNMDGDERNEEESSAILPTHTSMAAVSDDCNSCSSRGAVSGERNDGPVPCFGCQKPIYDRYYMWIDKRTWHETCVQCSACGQPLIKSCYTKNHKLYCQYDYKQLQTCRRCHQIISFNEYVLQVGGMPYHVNCFVCDYCHQHLQSGDQYLVHEATNQILCKACYAQGEESISGQYNQDDNSISDSERSDDDVFQQQALAAMGHMGYVTQGLHSQHGLLRSKNGSKSNPSLSLMATSSDGKRVKRPRTILTTAQRRKFKTSFEVSQKPCRKVRETLAAETGLSPRVVQVWFQNQRAKMKKLARRQQADGTGQGGNRSGSRARRKKTTDSDSDNEVLSSPGSSYTPISTPVQNQLFLDSYRSPGSIQTSPTTSASEVNNYFQQHPPSNHELSDVIQDEFDTCIFTTSGDYMTQTPHTVTSTANAVSLNTEMRLHGDVYHGAEDFGSSHTAPVILNADSVVVSSPHGGFQQFDSTQTHLLPFPNQGQDGTPIDRLMYMQNNYFRT